MLFSVTQYNYILLVMLWVIRYVNSNNERSLWWNVFIFSLSSYICITEWFYTTRILEYIQIFSLVLLWWVVNFQFLVMWYVSTWFSNYYEGHIDMLFILKVGSEFCRTHDIFFMKWFVEEVYELPIQRMGIKNLSNCGTGMLVRCIFWARCIFLVFENSRGV